MPRYFFDVHNVSPSVDHIDQELPDDDEAAWHESTVFAGELFKDIDGKIRRGQRWELHVADESRRTLFRIPINTEPLKCR